MHYSWAFLCFWSIYRRRTSAWSISRSFAILRHESLFFSRRCVIASRTWMSSFRGMYIHYYTWRYCGQTRNPRQTKTTCSGGWFSLWMPSVLELTDEERGDAGHLNTGVHITLLPHRWGVQPVVGSCRIAPPGFSHKKLTALIAPIKVESDPCQSFPATLEFSHVRSFKVSPTEFQEDL